MKTKIILISTLMSLLMVSCKDDADFEGSQLYYIYDYATHTATVTYTPHDELTWESSYSGDIMIPSYTKYHDEKFEVTGIGEGAFLGCKGMCSIKIPKNITRIDETAFGGNDDLQTISIDKGNPIYDSRYDCNAIIETRTNTLLFGFNSTIIPEDIISIGKYSFSGLTLESIQIPEGVKHIDHHALMEMPNLRSIVIPNSVEIIDENVLSMCNSLESAIIGKGIKKIVGAALSTDPRLKKITCYAIEPPENRGLWSISEEAILYVPAQSVNKYKEHEMWGSKFKDILPIETN